MVGSNSTRSSSPFSHPCWRLAAVCMAALWASGCTETGSSLDLPQGLASGRGENALAEGHFDHARTYLAEALAHDPSDADLWRNACLAWSSGALQDPARIIESCLGYLDRASETGAEDEVWDDAARRLIAAFVRSGDTTQARDWSAQLRDPVAAATAEASLWVADDPLRSLAALTPALASNPERADFHDVAAAVYEALGRDDEALHHLERSQAVDPLRPDLYERLAAWALRTGGAERAALESSRAAALARYEVLAAESAGPTLDRVIDSTNGPDRDADRLRALVGLDEAFPHRHPLVRLAKARLEIRIGHLDRGRKRLDGLVRQKLLTDEQRLIFAPLFQAKDRHGIVRDWLEPILAADPENTRARAILLDTLLALNALPAARVLLEEGLRLAPNRARFHAALAKVLGLQGSASGLERHLRRAIDLSPWDPSPRMALASFMLARGRRTGAKLLIAGAPMSGPELDAFAAENELDASDH